MDGIRQALARAHGNRKYQCLQMSEDDNLIVRKIWNRIDWRAQQGPVTPKGQTEIQRDDQSAIL